ncbi:hypothetical protein, partial [Pseudomonas aeruginosa]
MSEPTAHGSHGGCAHHHHHLPFGGGLLSRDGERFLNQGAAAGQG